jgi:hypothetical protein
MTSARTGEGVAQKTAPWRGGKKAPRRNQAALPFSPNTAYQIPLAKPGVYPLELRTCSKPHDFHFFAGFWRFFPVRIKQNAYSAPYI